MNNPSYITQTKSSKKFNVKAAILAGLMIVGFGQLIVSGIDYYQRKEFSDFLQRAEKVEALVTKVNVTTETKWSRSNSGHRTSTVTENKISNHDILEKYNIEKIVVSDWTDYCIKLNNKMT